MADDKKYQQQGGDIGRTAMWEGLIDPCMYQNHLHRLRPCSIYIFPLQRHQTTSDFMEKDVSSICREAGTTHNIEKMPLDGVVPTVNVAEGKTFPRAEF